MSQVQLAVRALLLLVLVCMSACTISPRNYQEITDRRQTFAGYHAQANDHLSLQLYNFNTATWDPIVSTRSATSSAFKDPCGYNWYPWQINAKLPANSGAPYWYNGPVFGNHLVARVVSRSGAYLYSFNEDSDACVAQYQCANDILANCGNSDGTITLFCDDYECL